MQFRSILSTTLSDSDLIERALDGIPKCIPYDRTRQKILLSALQAWSHLAEKHSIPYWIAYGSLIGYVQRRGLLPHDPDVDVVVMHEDTPKIVNISKTNFSADYEIKVQPQWEIIGETKRSYFRDQGIHFIAPNARFIDKKTRDHVDIFPGYNFNPLYANYTPGMKPTENVTEYDVHYNWLSYPKNWTYPLKTCYFSEIKVLCPAQPEKLVATMYGESALTKSNKKCVNGSWVSAE